MSDFTWAVQATASAQCQVSKYFHIPLFSKQSMLSWLSEVKMRFGPNG